MTKNGKAFGIDHIEKLVGGGESGFDSRNVMKDDPKLIESGKVSFKVVSGFDGLASGAPYRCDPCWCGCCVRPGIANSPACARRSYGIIPVGPENGAQEIYLIDKDADGKTLTQQSVMGVRYVPLTNKDHQMSRAR